MPVACVDEEMLELVGTGAISLWLGKNRERNEHIERFTFPMLNFEYPQLFRKVSETGEDTVRLTCWWLNKSCGRERKVRPAQTAIWTSMLQQTPIFLSERRRHMQVCCNRWA